MLIIITSFAIGILLIFVKYCRGIRWHSAKKKNPEMGEIKYSKIKPFTDGLLEYGIVISATIISFYSSYLLGLHTTELQKRKDSSSFLTSSLNNLDQFESSIRAVKGLFSNSDDKFIHLHEDSLTIREYIRTNRIGPYFILEHASPDQVLSFLTLTTYDIISVIEGNEKSAIKTINNRSFPYTYRFKTLGALLSLDELRGNMIFTEARYIDGEIDPDSLKKIQYYINDSSQKVLKTLPVISLPINPSGNP